MYSLDISDETISKIMDLNEVKGRFVKELLSSRLVFVNSAILKSAFEREQEYHLDATCQVRDVIR